MKTLTCDLCGNKEVPEEPFVPNQVSVAEDVRIHITRASRHQVGERRETVEEIRLGELCNECLPGHVVLVREAVKRG